MNNIGTVLRDLGKNQESLTYYEQSLAIRKKVYGGEHTTSAASLNNIGADLSDLVKKHDALTYYKQSSAIRRKGHREEQTAIADSLNNIGAVLRVLGKKLYVISNLWQFERKYIVMSTVMSQYL